MMHLSSRHEMQVAFILIVTVPPTVFFIVIVAELEDDRTGWVLIELISMKSSVEVHGYKLASSESSLTNTTGLSEVKLGKAAKRYDWESSDDKRTCKKGALLALLC